MKPFIGLLMLALLLWPSGPRGPALAQSPSPGAGGLKIEYFYDAPSEPGLRDIHNRLSSRDALAQLAHYLSPLHLPRPLILRMTECGNGETTRAYVPGKELVFCYEYLQRAERLARNTKDPDKGQHVRDVIVNGAFAHAILHLVAHAVFDQLQTPLWGNRNDAADRLASYVMVQVNPDKAAEWFIGAATYFALSGAESPADFTSLDSSDSQRFYDHFCFAQLAGPAAFAKLVGIAAERMFDGADAEKLKRVFGALALTDPASKMKAVEGLDPNDKIFQSRFYRRMKLCGQELNEARSAFNREIRPHIASRELIK